MRTVEECQQQLGVCRQLRDSAKQHVRAAYSRELDDEATYWVHRVKLWNKEVDFWTRSLEFALAHTEEGQEGDNGSGEGADPGRNYVCG